MATFNAGAGLTQLLPALPWPVLRRGEWQYSRPASIDYRGASQSAWRLSLTCEHRLCRNLGGVKVARPPAKLPRVVSQTKPPRCILRAMVL